jgi:hypothetical protein
MGHSKLIILFVWVSVFCLGSHALHAGAADPNYSQKIVTFYEDVAWEEIQQYAEEWRAHGVSIIMELPMFNCLVLKVPGNITASDLAADPRVQRGRYPHHRQAIIPGVFSNFMINTTIPGYSRVFTRNKICHFRYVWPSVD